MATSNFSLKKNREWEELNPGLPVAEARTLITVLYRPLIQTHLLHLASFEQTNKRTPVFIILAPASSSFRMQAQTSAQSELILGKCQMVTTGLLSQACRVGSDYLSELLFPIQELFLSEQAKQTDVVDIGCQ